MKLNVDTPTDDAQIQIIPLIDVIFCILTFFILAALQLTRQQAINIDLPQASTGTPLPGANLGNTQFREMLVVTIAPNGQTYLDKTPVDRSQLSQALAQYLQQNSKGIVVLNASPNAFYNEVIQVLDIMRAVGGNRVALATMPSSAASPNADLTQPSASPFATPSPTFSPFDPFNTPIPGNSPSSPTTAPNGTGSSGFDIFGTPSPKTPGR
ncbi:biopolymer transporter ExbD [Leptodesmis sp.]|uniref:biopolymer transporter ExbD n=1 Tax=Leptodesmis sp. TaxID=3100501 RepID=UPI004053559A